MRVLVTGSEGHIGQAQVKTLLEAGYELRTFDRTARGKATDWEHLPGDLRDVLAVRRAVQGMDAVVHLGAIASDRQGGADDLLAVNVQGTLNLLLACVEAGVERVISFSSINALGCVGGYRPAQYLPIDDAYPRHPLSPYQLSKHLGEEACRSFTDRHGIVTLCMRPVFVTGGERTGWWRRFRPDQNVEWGKDEYWAYVDIHDVCEATLLGLTVQNVSHDAFLLTAEDTSLDVPTAELVDRYYPDTPWKQDRAAYLAENPHRSLMDSSHARQVLGWQPKHSRREAREQNTAAR
jgi:nucleoside-diphosphate-sugar epimerase